MFAGMIATNGTARGRRLRRRLLASLILVLLVIGLGPAPAGAHTTLIQASPPIGQPAGGTIDFVDLAFAEPVTDATITVFLDDIVMPGVTTVSDGQLIRFELDSPLDTPGQYAVRYELTSFDGDDTDAIYFFAYDPDAIQPPRLGVADPGADDGGRNWTQIIATVVLAASLIGLLGLFVTRLDAKRRKAETSDQPGAR